jgi:tetratricopeptide (TPR) repeat protein
VNDVAPPALSAGQARELADALDRGDEHFRRADYLAAREEYTRALVIAGEEPGVRIPFGLAEFALGRYADASRAMRQSVSRPPILDPSSIDLRQAYARPAEFEAQLRTLESFIGRNPFDADALFLLGFLKACTNNPVGARAVFEKYLALREADPAARPFALGLTRRGP